jgi:maltose/moltooligosaccharide transporter
MATKARLNGFQIWNMCFGFFGIQIGFGLQNANTSRIFQGLGVQVDHLAILWIAAPATGLLVQPVIGYLSDKTWGRLGRRRPYVFWGAVLTSAALLVMPNAPVLWIAAAALWVMDASINITMEPFRAFVGDNLPDEQRASGYAMQSFFIGAGAVLASALPWILTNGFSVSNVAEGGGVPPSVHIAFYAGAAGLLLSVLWTVFTTREYSPEQLAAFEATERARKGEGRTPAPRRRPAPSAPIWSAAWPGPWPACCWPPRSSPRAWRRSSTSWPAWLACSVWGNWSRASCGAPSGPPTASRKWSRTCSACQPP